MKVRKEEFVLTNQPLRCKNIYTSICNVFWPFHVQIEGRRLSVHIARQNALNQEASLSHEINVIDALDLHGLYGHWDQYELVLFNIVQNAVKFNMYKGNILVLIVCKPMKEADRLCLEQHRKKKKWSPKR